MVLGLCRGGVLFMRMRGCQYRLHGELGRSGLVLSKRLMRMMQLQRHFELRYRQRGLGGRERRGARPRTLFIEARELSPEPSILRFQGRHRRGLELCRLLCRERGLPALCVEMGALAGQCLALLRVVVLGLEGGRLDVGEQCTQRLELCGIGAHSTNLRDEALRSKLELDVVPHTLLYEHAAGSR